MPEQDTIVCPDCGAAYQCSLEQKGKLLHCKCGRYLVTGGTNQKSEPVAKPPAVAVTTPKSETSFGVRASAATATKVKSAPAETVFEPAQAPVQENKSSSKVAYMTAAVAAVALLGFGIFYFRPATRADAVQPVQVQTTVHAAVPSDPCAATPVRLENGTVLAHSFLGNGMGKLEVENAMPSDVAVRLIGSANVTVAWVYVQEGEQVVIGNLPLGTYKVLVASGSNWNAQTLAFGCNDAYAEVDKPLEYIDRREDDHTVYSTYKLTLGKQRTAMVTKDEFFKGHIGR